MPRKQNRNLSTQRLQRVQLRVVPPKAEWNVPIADLVVASLCTQTWGIDVICSQIVPSFEYVPSETRYYWFREKKTHASSGVERDGTANKSTITLLISYRPNNHTSAIICPMAHTPLVQALQTDTWSEALLIRPYKLVTSSLGPTGAKTILLTRIVDLLYSWPYTFVITESVASYFLTILIEKWTSKKGHPHVQGSIASARW